MKRCSRCKVLKENGAFNRNSGEADGLSYYCRDCQHASNKKYYTSRKGKAATARARKTMRARYPERRRAYNLLWKAILRGKLSKKPCEVCGSQKVQAHHHDYSKPYEVKWLCHPHHLQEHSL